jgi:tetratricopeptide (TPR) repeat protein
MIYWITLSIVGICIIVMGVTLFRHWMEIRLLNPDSIAEEREKQKLDQLLMQRLTRKKTEKVAPFKTLLHQLVLAGKTGFHAAYIRLVRLEKLYKQAAAPFAMMAPAIKDRVKLLLDDARSLARDMKWADAERRYLEILAIDKRNFEAYKGLGAIYLKQKLYPQAKETYEFILRSRKADDASYAAMAEIAESEGDMKKAEDMRLKAVEAGPRLANRHAELASFYINGGKPDKAWESAKRCTELDPKSAKYLELSLEAAILLRDLPEAKRRYDKLRVLSDDRPRLQAIKSRIDAIEN